MKILFVNMSALKFTVATPDYAPLGGSESALCYLARTLSKIGHAVSLTANLPEGQEGVIKGVSHFSISAIKDEGFFSRGNFEVIVLCNVPAAASLLKALSPKSKIVLWAHALPDQPSMQILSDKRTKEAIDAVVFVSLWQQREIERVFAPFKQSQVIGNGIATPFEQMFSSADQLGIAKEGRAAYTTTPYRGLSVLLKAMEGYDRSVPLELFSSMNLYQLRDDEYAALFKEAEQNPVITNHRAITQSQLANKLRSCAFLFYPCIYPETFCITVAEGMAAGMKIVSTDLGALKETTMGYADLVPLTSSEGGVLVGEYRQAMTRAINEYRNDPTVWAQKMFAQSQRANETFSWKKRAHMWEEYLRVG